MIATEHKTPKATIRIHDESCIADPTPYLAHLNQIITKAHKRRIHPTEQAQNLE